MTWDRYDDPPVRYWTCETCGDQTVIDPLVQHCGGDSCPDCGFTGPADEPSLGIWNEMGRCRGCGRDR